MPKDLVGKGLRNEKETEGQRRELSEGNFLQLNYQTRSLVKSLTVANLYESKCSIYAMQVKLGFVLA